MREIKPVLWLILAALSVLGIPAVVLADGYLEYDNLATAGGARFAPRPVNWLAAGGQYFTGDYMLGLRYAVAASMGEGLNPGDAMSANMYAIHLGERFVDTDKFDLILLLGYHDWKWKNEGTVRGNALATSWSLGVQCGLEIGRFSLDLTALYGLANSFKYDDGTAVTASPAPGFRDLGLEGALKVGAGSEIFLVYRDSGFSDGDDDWGSKGFGLGLRTTF